MGGLRRAQGAKQYGAVYVPPARGAGHLRGSRAVSAGRALAGAATVTAADVPAPEPRVGVGWWLAAMPPMASVHAAISCTLRPSKCSRRRGAGVGVPGVFDRLRMSVS